MSSVPHPPPPAAALQVKLCDIVSGGFTHTLSGHRAAVWAVAWSPASEWQLATGGCDGQLRVWDIRRSGPLHVFDQHDTQQHRAQQRQRQREEGQQGEEQQEEQEGQAGDGAPAPDQQHRRQDAQQPGRRGQAVARQGSGGGGGGSGRAQRSGSGGDGGGIDSAAGSDRMFLPERVVKYSTAHAGSITGEQEDALALALLPLLVLACGGAAMEAAWKSSGAAWSPLPMLSPKPLPAVLQTCLSDLRCPPQGWCPRQTGCTG